MKTTEELLPCPVCGDTSVRIFYNDDNVASVGCRNCQFETRDFRREESAIRVWNSLPRRSDIECVKRERDWLLRRISGKLCNESKKDCPARDNVNDFRCMECWSKTVKEATSCRKS